MIKTTNKHYELFKSEIAHWITLFEMTKSWRIYFKHKDLKDACADSEVRNRDRVVIFQLNTIWESKIEKLTDEVIKETAKHEAIHLLLGRMRELGHERHTTEEELNEAEEQLVNILIKLIS